MFDADQDIIKELKKIHKGQKADHKKRMKMVDAGHNEIMGMVDAGHNEIMGMVDAGHNECMRILDAGQNEIVGMPNAGQNGLVGDQTTLDDIKAILLRIEKHLTSSKSQNRTDFFNSVFLWHCLPDSLRFRMRQVSGYPV